MGFLKEKSKYAGTCKKDSTHAWPVDGPVYMQKNADNNWLMCSSKECFVSQGGTIEEARQGGKGRSLDMSFAFGKAFDEWAWKLANQHACELYPLPGGVTPTQEQFRERAIATESIYHTLCEAFNGK